MNSKISDRDVFLCSFSGGNIWLNHISTLKDHWITFRLKSTCKRSWRYGELIKGQWISKRRVTVVLSYIEAVTSSAFSHNTKLSKAQISQIFQKFYFDSELCETGSHIYIYTSPTNSWNDCYYSFMYDGETTAWPFDIFSQILWPLSLLKFALKRKNREICDIRAFDFWIVRVLVIWQLFQLQFMIENDESTLWHLSQISTLSQSTAFSS